jgi:glycosyltransferase involved in cell wall biosynthesis
MMEQISGPQVSAIVPARNEEAVIAACVESLAVQPEIREVFVVDDESSDRTSEIVAKLAEKYPNVRLLRAGRLPEGWVGKNHAVWIGALAAHGDWLLFTDADAVHAPDSARQALGIAQGERASLVSYSPEQVMQTWYEKALIPYIYCRLSRFFSYDDVNNPSNPSAAANGQFLLISREAYDAIGGHASVAGEVLEDVALAKRVKESGRRIWFGSGQGVVRVRMYRSFAAMWQGWKKNLYQLIGANGKALRRELRVALLPLGIAVIAGISLGAWWNSVALGLATMACGLVVVHIVYDGELRRNLYPSRLGFYGVPGRLLYAGLVLASQRSHTRGKVLWKGREYPTGTGAASK